MPGRRKNPLWRQTFLRALARTGNVRASAVEAGVDVGTAYDHRVKDPGFAAKWAAALVKAKACAKGPLHRLRRSPSPGKPGEELVVRRTKHGDQLIRAGAGRWCAEAEAVFFEALMETACVRSAARACGFSKNALYARREAYPEFAEKWDRVLAQAKAQLPDMLAAAAIASLDPDAGPGTGRRGLPKLDVDHAIRISAIEQKRAAAPARRGIRPRVATNAEVKAALEARLKVYYERMKKVQLAEGWTRTEDGHFIPPGWVFVGTGGAQGEAGEAGEGDGADA